MCQLLPFDQRGQPGLPGAWFRPIPIQWGDSPLYDRNRIQPFAMITPQYVQMMAAYSQWQHEQLLSRCDQLASHELSQDRGMFFGSILHTLNHIIHVDLALHKLIHTQQFANFDPRGLPFPDYTQFKRERQAFDQQLRTEAAILEQPWLDETLKIWSDRLQRHRHLSRGLFYVQLFNHQTHHRSQITSELHKLGIDYGNTDVPFNPYFEF